MTPAEFYTNPDLADGFNIWPHPWRSQPHRGLDFPKPGGTPIPSINHGVVVISEWNGYLGWIAEVRGDDGTYIGYCHMRSQGLPAGTRVSHGTIVGHVGETGSQANGNHLHITKGDREGAVRGSSLAWLSDPWPYIQAHINDTSEEDEMNYINIQGKAGARRGGAYIVIGREAFFAGKFVDGIPVISDEGAIAELQKRISGLR